MVTNSFGKNLSPDLPNFRVLKIPPHVRTRNPPNTNSTTPGTQTHVGSTTLKYGSHVRRCKPHQPMNRTAAATFTRVQNTITPFFITTGRRCYHETVILRCQRRSLATPIFFPISHDASPHRELIRFSLTEHPGRNRFFSTQASVG